MRQDVVLTCGAGGKSANDSCLQVAQCDGACEKDAAGDKFPCTTACYAKGTSAAQAEYNALLKCILTVQSGGGDPGKECGKVVVSCADAKPDGTKGALGRQEISECDKKCQDAAGGKDDGCAFTCLNKSTKTEALKWWDMVMCSAACNDTCKDSQAPGCTDDCFSKSCKKPYLACLGA